MELVLNQHKFPEVILKYRIIRTRLLLILLHLDDEIVERIEDSLSLFCVFRTRRVGSRAKVTIFFVYGRQSDTRVFVLFTGCIARMVKRPFFFFFLLPSRWHTERWQHVLFQDRFVYKTNRYPSRDIAQRY